MLLCYLVTRFILYICVFGQSDRIKYRQAKCPFSNEKPQSTFFPIGFLGNGRLIFSLSFLYSFYLKVS